MRFPGTAYIILGMLADEDLSGYDLKQRLQGRIHLCYDSPAKSQIYGELRRLKRQGFVTATEVEQTHRPDKHVYTITDAGRAAVTKWLCDVEMQEDSFKSPLLLRLFFGHLLPPDMLIRRLRARHEKLKEELLACERAESQLFEACGACPHNTRLLHELFLARFQLTSLCAKAAWIADAIERLEVHSPAKSRA